MVFSSLLLSLILSSAQARTPDRQTERASVAPCGDVFDAQSPNFFSDLETQFQKKIMRIRLLDESRAHYGELYSLYQLPHDRRIFSTLQTALIQYLKTDTLGGRLLLNRLFGGLPNPTRQNYAAVISLIEGSEFPEAFTELFTRLWPEDFDFRADYQMFDQARLQMLTDRDQIALKMLEHLEGETYNLLSDRIQLLARHIDAISPPTTLLNFRDALYADHYHPFRDRLSTALNRKMREYQNERSLRVETALMDGATLAPYAFSVHHKPAEE